MPQSTVFRHSKTGGFSFFVCGKPNDVFILNSIIGSATGQMVNHRAAVSLDSFDSFRFGRLCSFSLGESRNRRLHCLRSARDEFPHGGYSHAKDDCQKKPFPDVQFRLIFHKLLVWVCRFIILLGRKVEILLAHFFIDDLLQRIVNIVSG